MPSPSTSRGGVKVGGGTRERQHATQHATHSQEGSHAPSEVQPTGTCMHTKTGYVHKPPHAGAEGPGPCQGKRREGHAPVGEKACRLGAQGSPQDGGRRQGGRKPGGLRPDNNKDGERGSPRRSGCAWPGCTLPLFLPGHAWSPGAPGVGRERLRGSCFCLGTGGREDSGSTGLRRARKG